MYYNHSNAGFPNSGGFQKPFNQSYKPKAVFYPQPQQFYGQPQQFYGQPRPVKKHSGAKHRTYSNSSGLLQYLTTGWRLSRNKELIAYKAVTTKKSELSDKGWFGSVWVTLTNKVTGEVNSHWGTMQKSTGKVIISDLGVVMNPRANNGGYCGSFTKK